jgi:hypothetical protein
MNEVWLELVFIANDLLACTKTLLLGRELGSLAAPGAFAIRLLYVAARLAFSGSAHEAAPAGKLGLGGRAHGGVREIEVTARAASSYLLDFLRTSKGARRGLLAISTLASCPSEIVAATVRRDSHNVTVTSQTES